MLTPLILGIAIAAQEPPVQEPPAEPPAAARIGAALAKAAEKNQRVLLVWGADW